MVWQLTLQAWAFKGLDHEPRIRVAAYATPKATGDIDIWIAASAENAEKVWAALLRFGAYSRTSPRTTSPLRISYSRSESCPVASTS